MKLHKNRNSGFTLVEALATAAILIILLGLSAVGVARWRDPLKITELDNAARAIYMAAENRAVLLQNSGAAVSLLTVPAAPDPGDLTSSSATVTQGGKKETVSLCVLSDTTAADILDELLPVGVIDPTLREGHFYILYDQSTYHVFEVFYAEKPFSLPEKEEDMKILRGSRSERVSYYHGDTTKRCLVGHYEGGLAGKIGAKPLPTPGVEVSITNGNELTLTVKYTIPNDLPSGVKYSPSVRLNYPGATPKQDLLSVNNSGMIIPVDGGRLIEEDNFAIAKAGDTVTYTWVLDSLEQDGGSNFTKQFKGLFSNPGAIAFGNDFTVTASLGLSADGYISSSFSVEGTNNSLFASVSGDTDRTAYIENLRHLQNLDSTFSRVEKITYAVQTTDIDAGTFKDADYEFIPIINWDLFGYRTQRSSEETGPCSISNLSVTKASATGKNGAGLFGIAQVDFEFQDIYVDRPKINGGASQPAAALLGYSWNPAKFKNCQVVSAEINSGGAAGGMLGNGVSATFTDCVVKDVSVKSESSHAGGLVGNMLYTFNFTRCQVVNAGVYSTGGVVGGMAGYTWSGNITFKDCAVKGSVKMDGSSTGGLMGSEGMLGAVTLTNCRVGEDGSAINLNGWVNAGGMVGNMDGTATFTDCTVGKFGSGEKPIVITAGNYAGGLVGNSIAGTFTGCKVSSAQVGNAGRSTAEAGGLVGRTEGWNNNWTETWRVRGAAFQGCIAENVSVNADVNAGGLVGGAIDARMMYYNGPCTARDVTVEATNNAGGLAGTSIRGSFSDCQAVNATVSSEYLAGGLIGGVYFTYYTDAENKTEESIPAGVEVTNLRNCQVYWNKDKLSGKTDYKVDGMVAGGLVGMIRNGAVINASFAATLVKGIAYAGGLVGSFADEEFRPSSYEGDHEKISTTTIKNSYADCYIWVGAINSPAYISAGGLIGVKEVENNRLAVMDVYAAGYIQTDRSTAHAAGLCGGQVHGITAENVYAAMYYEGIQYKDEYIFPLAYDLSEGENPNCYWLKYPTFNIEKWGRINYNHMSAPAFANTMGSAFTNPVETHPYWNTGIFPFPGLEDLPHYGDWPTS